MNVTRISKTLAVATVSVLAVAGAARLYASVSIASTDVPHAIPDNGSLNTTLVVDNSTVPGGAGFPGAWPVTDANLMVDITHTWDGDIVLTLSAPAGQPPSSQNVMVWNNCGGSGDNMTGTVIDDAGAAPTCTSAGAPFAGTFQATVAGAPVPTAMASFNVADGKGTWTLAVGDDSSICTGTLNAWSLTLDGPAPLPVELTDFDVQ